MSIAKRVDLTAFRKDPLYLTLAVTGFDLTGATMAFAARAYRDAPGAALIGPLTETVTPGAPGIRLVRVDHDDDGVPTSLLEIVDAKAVMGALPLSAEAGDSLKLAHDFQWTLPTDGSGLTSHEQTVLWGDLTVEGSVNG